MLANHGLVIRVPGSNPGGGISCLLEYFSLIVMRFNILATLDQYSFIRTSTGIDRKMNNDQNIVYGNKNY